MQRTVLAVEGSWGRVEFSAEDDGKSELYETFLALPHADQVPLHVSMKKLADAGRISNKQKFKKVENSDVFEFKEYQQRFVGFFRPGRRFIIAAHEQKKKDRLSPATIKRAESVLERMKKEEKVHALQRTR